MARPRTEEMLSIFEREWMAAGWVLRNAKRPRQFFNGLLASHYMCVARMCMLLAHG